MGYATHVGRIGALAVALGVGATVASSPTAWADDAASPSASSSASKTNSGVSNRPKGVPRIASSEKNNPGVRLGSSNLSAGAKDSPATPSKLEWLSARNSSAASSKSSDSTTLDDENRSSSQSGSPRNVHLAELPSVSERVHPIRPDVPTGVVDDARALTTADAAAERPSTGSPTLLPARIANAATTPSPAAVPRNEATPALVPASLPEAIVQIANELLRAVVAPFTVPIPIQPNSPLSPLLSMVEWFRRTTVGAIYNRAPQSAPLQIGEDVNGVVVGTIGATDPDGDPLTYTVVQKPKYGTVVVNNDGTYTYTPGTLLAQDGGTDTFTVDIHDNGLRLLSEPGITSASVSVTVGAGDALGIGGTPFGIAMSPDGRRAYVTNIDTNRVTVVDIASGSVVDSIPVGKAPYGIAVAGDGRAYVVNSDDSTVSVIDTATNTVVSPPIYVGNSPTSIAVNASGTRVIVTASDDDAISIIDTTTFNVTAIPVGEGAFGVAISGNKAFITNEFDDTVSVVDLTSNTVIKTIAVGVGPTGIAAGGNRVVVTNTGSFGENGDASVSVIDVDTLSLVGAPITGWDAPAGVTVDAAGRYAYITDMGSATMSVLDLKSGKIEGPSYDVADGATGVAIGADGRIYIAGSFDGTIDPVTLRSPAQFALSPLPAVLQPVQFTPAQGTMSAAAAAATANPAGASITVGFDIYNLTTQPVTLIGYNGPGRPDRTVPLNFQIPPGGKLHFEVPASVTFGGGPSTVVAPIFKNTVTGEVWTVSMTTQTYLFGVSVNGVSGVSHAGGTGTSSPGEPGWFGSPGGTSITLLEAPDTVLTLEKGDPRQGKMLSALCNGGAADCYPVNTRNVEKTWTDWEVSGGPGVPAVDNNYSPTPRDYSVEITSTQSTKFSIEGSLKLGISLSKALSADLATKIGQEVSNSYTYKLAVKFTTPAMKKVTISVRKPIVRVTGDMQITIGNTTILLKDVTYDLPDSTRGMQYDTNVTEADNTNALL
jgi:YVTN family beta-propeller protein